MIAEISLLTVSAKHWRNVSIAGFRLRSLLTILARLQIRSVAHGHAILLYVNRVLGKVGDESTSGIYGAVMISTIQKAEMYSQCMERRENQGDIQVTGNEVQHPNDRLERLLDLLDAIRIWALPVEHCFVHQCQRQVWQDVNQLWWVSP